MVSWSTSPLTTMSTTTALAATTDTMMYPTGTTLSAFALSISSPSPSPQSPPYSPGGSGNAANGDENGECRLLGPFSLLVQAALGILALSSLVYKRWKERPQRPVKVWAFDASKQVFGSSMLHLANLLMSMFSAGQFEIKSDYKPNPCSFYLLNLGIDVSLYHFGIFSRSNLQLTLFYSKDNAGNPNSHSYSSNIEYFSFIYSSSQAPRVH